MTLERLLLEMTHPVGSYYWSSDSKTPGEIFGGTWEQIKDKFVFAAGSKAVNITGGEEKHTLTTEEMPSHNHTLKVNLNGGGGYYGYPSGSVNPPNWINSSAMMSTVGGSQPHNNMPPYIVAYCWRRTA